MFIAKHNNLIIEIGNTEEEIINKLYLRLYDTIEETETEYELYNGKFYTKEEMVTKRQQDFESKFLETSLGCYRLQPKGYANAQQSIDTINNIVNIAGELTEEVATMILFYQKPDFTKPEECAEEWLIQHQYSCEPMTKEQWTLFYVEFTTLYAQKQYQQQLLAQQQEE